MTSELQAYALKTTLTEIKNTRPDVSNAFIFVRDGTVVALDEDTEEERAQKAAEALNEVFKKADTIGDFEFLAFRGSNNAVNVFRTNNNYLALIGPQGSDLNGSTSFARILIPTVLRLTEKLGNHSAETFDAAPPEIHEEMAPNVEETGTDLEAKEISVVETEPVEEKPEPEPKFEILPEPPVTQFMVENLGGLFASSDTVRIDNVLIQQWKDLYGEIEIHEVDVETLNGETVRCKFKPIKDSKHDGKGIIQLPLKIQLMLQASKGGLVIVKPVIE